MKGFLVVAVVALIHGNYATLLIKGPTEPVLEGDMVTLECVYKDSDLNISQVRIEKFYEYLQGWYDPARHRYWCFSDRMRLPTKSPVLTLPHVGRFSEGTYRCVSDANNVTDPDNSSQPLTLKVHYMGELSLSREGYNYLGIPADLRVRVGDDVVVKCSSSSSEEPTYTWKKETGDWILPSSTLTLRKVSAMDGGAYTCTATHPSVESLSKKRTISITVLPEDAPWYETSNGRLVLMTSAAAAALMVFIISMSVFLCRRAKQAKSSKGPIDDRSQKKPIYKNSVESLPSTCGDKQPLV